MASKKAAKVASVDALAPDDGVTIPRLSLGEQGFSALKVRQGRVYEEANASFRMPQLAKVVAEMQYSPVVNVGLGAINTLMNRSEVIVEPVTGETPTDKARRDYLASVLHDMDTSWQATMQGIGTYKEWGHQVSEMVFRRRLYKNGSKWNDGLIGLKGLKNRPQATIARWNFSLDGRTLESVSQTLAGMENAYRFVNLQDANGFIIIPREKFILFRCDASSDNPEGTSILRSVYLAYKQLTLLTDNLMIGVSKDIAGLPFAQLPPKYMSPDASAEDKAVYAAAKAIVDNISTGQQSGIIFPKMVDPESKADMFSFSLLEQKGGKAYDLPAIIKMLQSNILSVLSCDSIAMGTTGGSLSLQDGSTNLLALQVSYRLSEIANTLNQELVPTLWRMNGWSCENLPKICFKDVSSVSLEEASKYLQRVASVGLLELDRGVLNRVREIIGFEPKPEDEPIDFENLSTTLSGKATSSSQGMAVGVGGVNGGTSTSSKGGKDTSAQNADNSA